MRFNLVAGAILLSAVSSVADSPVPKLRVPDGFTIERVAGAPNVVFPMFACFDDRGRLFVAESSGLDLYAELQKQTRKCRIHLLEDKDGDGFFETARVFADQLVFPMGLAWRDGKLYVADPPDLVVYEATGEREPAGPGPLVTKRSVILSGFGHRDNGSLHGLTFGPDGLLYMTMGDPDGYRLKRSDGTTLEGKTGALLRCRPDGSQVEVLCGGFENLIEIVFTPRGEIIGTDNWFQRPVGGIRDALVHLVPGGLYPLHPERTATALPSTGAPLPPIALFPAVAMSGLCDYRHRQAFPAEMIGNLFAAQHNSRKVSWHLLVPHGSTFRTQDHDFVTTDDPDFHPSDVLEDADGSLLIIDTGSWYVHHCPTGQIRKTQATGGIYRVRFGKAKPGADPWGRKVSWNDSAVDALVPLLHDSRPFVRQRAQAELAKRGKSAIEPLTKTALDRDTWPLVTRQQAVWALAAIDEEAALVALRNLVRMGPAELAIPAARALALRRDRQAGAVLAGRLCEPGASATGDDSLRLALAEALAVCGNEKAVPALWQVLSEQPDRFLEHAVVYALHRLASDAELEKALANEHPRVQKAALILLDQRPGSRLGHEAVLRRVTSADADLRQTALRILQQHPEWADHAVGLIKGWLDKPKLTAEESLGLRSSILAFQGQRAVQDLVGAAAAGKAPLDRQALVLETLAQCTLSKLPPAWTDALAQSLGHSSPNVRLHGVRTAAVLQVAALDDALGKMAESPSETVELRLEALRAVVLRRPKLSSTMFELLLKQLDDEAAPPLHLAAGEVLGRAHLTPEQVGPLLKAVRNDALISPAVLLPALERSVDAATAPALLDYLAESVRNGWKPSEPDLVKVLDRFPAAVRAKVGPIRELLRQSGERERARLQQFEPLLTGGDTGRGKAVFFGKKVACATCHRVGSEGGQVGPDLTKVGAIRAGRDLLESVLVPSSTIAQGFENYLLATKEGRLLTGVLARQSGDTLFLRDSSGAELRVRKDQVQEMRRLPTSLMPEGLERALSPDEFRDLLAYLRGLQ